MAKRHLFGLRESTLRTLHEMGLMQPSVTHEITEDVLPWLIAHTQRLIYEDDQAIDLSSSIIHSGVIK